jgi:hypothetical protein
VDKLQGGHGLQGGILRRQIRADAHLCQRGGNGLLQALRTLAFDLDSVGGPPSEKLPKWAQLLLKRAAPDILRFGKAVPLSAPPDAIQME